MLRNTDEPAVTLADALIELADAKGAQEDGAKYRALRAENQRRQNAMAEAGRTHRRTTYAGGLA
jgi:hypothetical protein